MDNVTPFLVQAREALLDVCDALWDQREALVLVGAQAVYLHTGDANLNVDLMTKDSDLAFDPDLLQIRPLVEDSLKEAGFFQVLGGQPGAWMSSTGVPIDLMVPEKLARGSGTRSVDITPHSKLAMRRTHGLEAAILDNDFMDVPSLEINSLRVVNIRVAGPAALIVAKLIKLGERLEGKRATDNKDAFDIFRLLKASKPHEIISKFLELLGNPLSADVVQEALVILETHFAVSQNSVGNAMVKEYVGSDSDTSIQVESWGLAKEILIGMQRSS